MKALITGLLLAAAAAGIGCDGPTGDVDCANVWMVDEIQNVQIANGIIAQRTVFPYHFVTNCADLNELGQADLCVLARHFQKCPGQLSVRRGGVSDQLYACRVQAVRDFLGRSGVQTDRVQFIDAPAGGDGMSSEDTAQVLNEMYRELGEGTYERSDEGCLVEGVVAQ